MTCCDLCGDEGDVLEFRGFLPTTDGRHFTATVAERSSMLNRRTLLQGMAAGTGAALGCSLLPERLMASSTGAATPKRIVFFMQNQGFDPKTCVPEGMSSSGSLANITLPEPHQSP